MAAQTEPISNTALISNKALWAGRILSSLVVAFLLLDGAIKLIPLDIVVQTLSGPRHPGPSGANAGRPDARRHAPLRDPAHVGARRILLTGYLGGAIYMHVRAGSPLFTHTLFGVY